MAKKRTRQAHSGTVYQSGGVWFAAVMVAGKRRRVRCVSKADANAKRHELCQLAAAGSNLQPASFGIFRARWIEHIKANKAANTVVDYEFAIEYLSALDSIPLERITGQAIQTEIDKLTGAMRQRVFDKCKQMLEIAIKWGCLHEHPMKRLERPTHKAKSIDPFELTEVSAIIEESKHTRYGAAIHLAFACGLRGGELWGLKWSDLTGNELCIQRQAADSGGRIEIKTPKTSAGIRRIMLPDSVVDALAVKRADAMRDGQAGVEWMFPSNRGTVTRRGNFGYLVWRPLLENLGIRHRGMHHARHTAATLLLNSGSVPLAVVSRMLGHASPAVTLKTYAHVMTADQNKHRNAFDLVLKIG